MKPFPRVVAAKAAKGQCIAMSNGNFCKLLKKKICNGLILFFFLHLFVFCYWWLSFQAKDDFDIKGKSTRFKAPPQCDLDTANFSNSEKAKLCSGKPSGLLGYIPVWLDAEPMSLSQTEKANPSITEGGYFKPANCTAMWKVAFIIPFRNRERHLLYFLQHMLPILQRQRIEYRMYVINQCDGGKFNRAKLLNIGFSEAIKDMDFNCFIFHDVDLILENDYAMYACCKSRPRHLAVAIDNNDYKLYYKGYFGGANAFTRDQFEKINGHSNTFLGWGGEDDDLYQRVTSSGMIIQRYSQQLSRYRMLSHLRDKGNEMSVESIQQLTNASERMVSDGLTNLKYNVIFRENYKLFTKISVDSTGLYNECDKIFDDRDKNKDASIASDSNSQDDIKF